MGAIAARSRSNGSDPSPSPNAAKPTRSITARMESRNAPGSTAIWPSIGLLPRPPHGTPRQPEITAALANPTPGMASTATVRGPHGHRSRFKTNGLRGSRLACGSPHPNTHRPATHSQAISMTVGRTVPANRYPIRPQPVTSGSPEEGATSPTSASRFGSVELSGFATPWRNSPETFRLSLEERFNSLTPGTAVPKAKNSPATALPVAGVRHPSPRRHSRSPSPRHGWLAGPRLAKQTHFLTRPPANRVGDRRSTAPCWGCPIAESANVPASPGFGPVPATDETPLALHAR
jgi:hypothetical protein